MAESTQKKLQCAIVTPETTVLDQPVDFVAIPLYDGELGVLPGRAPLVARLGYGELRARSGNDTSSYFIDGGFLQVNNDIVTVLTSGAISANRIDPSAANSELQKANEQVPTTPEGFESKVISISRARAKIQVARRAGKS